MQSSSFLKHRQTCSFSHTIRNTADMRLWPSCKTITISCFSENFRGLCWVSVVRRGGGVGDSLMGNTYISQNNFSLIGI